MVLQEVTNVTISNVWQTGDDCTTESCHVLTLTTMEEVGLKTAPRSNMSAVACRVQSIKSSTLCVSVVPCLLLWLGIGRRPNSMATDARL